MNFNSKFGFSSRQYKGLVLILVLNVLVVLVYIIQEAFYDYFHPIEDFRVEFILEPSKEKKMEVDSFYNFDPNTATIKELTGLGLKTRVAQRISNYRSKGGVFRTKEDLLKIYEMDTTWYINVEPFIDIPENKRAKIGYEASESAALKPFKFEPNLVTIKSLQKMGLPKPVINSWIGYLKGGGRFDSCSDLSKLYFMSDSILDKLVPYCTVNHDDSYSLIEINKADSVELLAINGVGPVFSHRILAYRNRLGGFVKLEQLKEVYGVSDTLYKAIIDQVEIKEQSPRVIYINEDDFKELLDHPYLNYEQVKKIKNYVQLIGPLENCYELLMLEGFKEQDTLRLKPYIRF